LFYFTLPDIDEIISPCPVYFCKDRDLTNSFPPGSIGTSRKQHLPISVYQVARITGMSHRHPAQPVVFLLIISTFSMFINFHSVP
jgi:hypothetical protein